MEHMSFPRPEAVIHHAPSALLAVLVLAVVGTVAWRNRARIRRLVTTFWVESDSAFNLGLFRVLFFLGATFLWLPTGPSLEEVQSLTRIPDSLVFEPQVLGGLLAAIPRSHGSVAAWHTLLLVTAITAAIGLMPRVSAALWTIAAFNYVGIPNLFGKVDHHQHLIWIGAVFALSPAGDVLSVQSVIRSVRGYASVPTETRARRYAIPLRCIWVFLGILYLFPGLYKYAGSGLGWFNPSVQAGWIHAQMANGRTPLVDVSGISPLLFMGALFGLVFETTAILLILNRITRVLLAGMILFFHSMTFLIMGIPFVSLQVCAPSLIDWASLSEWRFRRKGQLHFAADANCGICQKTVEVLKAQSLPGGILFSTAQAVHEGAGVNGLTHVSLDDLVTDIHLTDGERVWVGYDAYRRAAWRLPALWIFLPFLYLWPVRKVGMSIYGHVARNRTCGVRPPEPRVRGVASPYWPLAVAVPVVATMLVCALPTQPGMRPAVAGWPVSVYPLFAGEPRQQTVRVFARYSGPGIAGGRSETDLHSKFPGLNGAQAQVFFEKVIKEKDPVRIQALLDVASEGMPKGTDVKLVAVHTAVIGARSAPDPDKVIAHRVVGA